ncbi:MAG: hypothetical protein OER88_05590, partial [Planctomycetota bacterium]|nr:hypothetical protein [Planctomycetota bacterium]
MAYRAQSVSLEEVDRAVAAREGGRFDFAAAVRLAQRQNADLRRLAAEARAAGLAIPPVAATATANTRSEVAGARVDLLQLVKVGPRGAAAKTAHARRVEALAALREAEQTIAVRIAESFLVERVLRDRAVPAIDLDADRFHTAGLASDADRQRVDFARTAEAAEHETVAAQREANLAHVRELLGLGSAAPVELVLPEDPAFATVRDARVIDRPDLARVLAAYYTADAEFRRAVIEQYPTLELGGEIAWNGSGSGGLVALRIPLGAAEPARAAGERREAARIAVEAALLQAQREAAVHAAQLRAADARAVAFGKRAVAATALYEAALARLDVFPD